MNSDIAKFSIIFQTVEKVQFYSKMRLFSTPKTSPELVRHAIVEDNNDKSAGQNDTNNSESKAESMPPNINEGNSTPPRTHSPSLVRGVSTLGRKFSRRFEKFGDSETARKLRMASPSRKYHFNASANNSGLPSLPTQTDQGKNIKSILNASEC